MGGRQARGEGWRPVREPRQTRHPTTDAISLPPSQPFHPCRHEGAVDRRPIRRPGGRGYNHTPPARCGQRVGMRWAMAGGNATDPSGLPSCSEWPSGFFIVGRLASKSHGLQFITCPAAATIHIDATDRIAAMSVQTAVWAGEEEAGAKSQASQRPDTRQRQRGRDVMRAT